MGITGLLPFLKKIHEPVNIAKFSGCTVAIDAYCWLHKGAFSCAEKLVLGEKTDQYVYYCMKFLEYMLKNNLKPILVFDGCHLPSKAGVEKSRREKREINRKKAAKLLREGNRAEARDCLQKCVDISPEMALRLMEVCRERGIDCIQAPYEADSQLAYLNKAGIAQIIVTEDSDLLLFGCEKVIFKMDVLGNGVMIEKTRLNEVLEIQNGFYTFEKFRYMCILSGCDYLSSLPGIGLAKACKVFKLARQADLRTLLKKFPSTYLKMSLVVSQEYIEGFIRADNTFLYQLVFDPLSRQLIPLNEYKDGLSHDNMPYAGFYFPHEKALQIALGNINIYNMQKFADFDPDIFVPSRANKRKIESLHMLSVWDKNYRVRPKSFLTDVQSRPNTKGKEITVTTKLPRIEFKVQSAEDVEDVKTDRELSSLYQISPSNQVIRKRKYERGNSDEDPLLKKRNYLTTFTKYEEFTQGHCKPELYNCLVEADTTVTYGATKVVDNKENYIKSPRRNRFVVRSPSKKHKFDLNAPKEVVTSRFFTSSPENEMKLEMKNSGDKNDKEEQIPENISSHSNVMHGFNTSKRCTPVEVKRDESKSAFSWCRFKSTNFKNIEASPSSRNAFKRVMSDVSSPKQEFSTPRLSDSVCRPDPQIDSSDCNNIDKSYSSCDKETSNHCQSDEMKLPRKISDVLPNGCETEVIIVDNLPACSKTGAVKDITKASLTSGCRVSGLSKKIPVNNKQLNLKDMLSKFSNNRSKDLPKIKHEKNKDIYGTPSASSDVLSVTSGLQRCILP